MNLEEQKKQKNIYKLGILLLGFVGVYFIVSLLFGLFNTSHLKTFTSIFDYYSFVGNIKNFTLLYLLYGLMYDLGYRDFGFYVFFALYVGAIVFAIVNIVKIVKRVEYNKSKEEGSEEPEKKKGLVGPIIWLILSLMIVIYPILESTRPIDVNYYDYGKYESSGLGRILQSAEPSNNSFEGIKDVMNDMSTGSSNSESSHSETYVQVEGIDEADIVKTDGEYIYYVSKDDGNVHIVHVDKDKLVENSKLLWSNFVMTPQTMFLDGDKLIVIGDATDIKNYDYKNARKSRQHFSGVVTVVSIFDISDKSNPEEVYTFSHFGNYKTARYMNHQLYLVSTHNFYWDGGFFGGSSFSRVRPAYGSNGESKNLPMKDVYYFDYNKSASSFTTISTIDVKDLKSIDVKAVCGSVNDIYMNQNNLYLAMSTVNYGGGWFYRYLDDNTDILKIGLKDGKLKIDDVITVPGVINNQYSMDEYNDYFRVATTTTSDSWVKGNHIFIIDDKCEVVGHIDKLAYNEDIKAVRYMGDVAYVITYRNTDPLFVLDLSNPKKPLVKGEVEITGFSSMLEPIDENTILGIGYMGDDWDDGMKLSLFDVSNPFEPKVLDSLEKDFICSDVQQDPHALLKNTVDGYYGFAYSNPYMDYYLQYNEDSSIESDKDGLFDDGWVSGNDISDNSEKEQQDNLYGVCLFKIKDDKILIYKDYELDVCSSRVVYIDNYIYAIGDNGVITPIEVK